VKDFRKLLVWEKGHQLTLAIYRVTTAFPSEETYGLTSQMRRAAKGLLPVFPPNVLSRLNVHLKREACGCAWEKPRWGCTIMSRG